MQLSVSSTQVSGVEHTEVVGLIHASFWRGTHGSCRSHPRKFLAWNTRKLSVSSTQVLRGLMATLIRRAALYFVVSLLLATIYSNIRLATYSNEAIAATIVLTCASMVLTSMFFEKARSY
jgi:hypothetical protein